MESRVPFGSLVVAALLITFSLALVGTAGGWLIPWVRLASTALIAALILLWLWTLTRMWDVIDSAAAVVVIAVGLATMASVLPRMSGEAFYATLGYAALFGMARRLTAGGVQAFVRAGAVVAIVLAAAFAVIWGRTWLVWILDTGTPPPLSLALPSAPFGHRHDVALLVALLAPALMASWSKRRSQRVIVVGGLAAISVVVFMSGGRAAWLGIGVATVAVFAMSFAAIPAAEWAKRHWALVGTILLTAVILVAASGFGQSVVSRMTATETIAMRTEIWGASAQTWLHTPWLGSGPGTFPFAIEGTGYFNQSVFAPKHADNVYVQTLSELGVIGAIALAGLGLTVASAWRRARPPLYVIWAVLFAVVAGIGANPAALGFTAMLIVFWAGLSVPSRGSAKLMRVPRLAPVLAGAVGIVPVVAVTWSAFAFDAGRAAADVGRLDEARSAFGLAISLDPAFAPYRRERAVINLRSDAPGLAVSDALAAVERNRLDDTSFRVLALALLEDGRSDEALAAARQGTDLQQTDPLNQAVLALAARAVGDSAAVDDALRDLLVVAPWAAADPTWSQAFPGEDPSEALARASEVRPPLDTVDPRWTRVLAGSSVAIAEDLTEAQAIFVRILDCQIDQAAELARDADVDHGADPDVSFAAAVALRLTGVAESVQLAPQSPFTAQAFGDRLVDEARYARRMPDPWDGVQLPTDAGGRTAWVANPGAALVQTRGSGCR